MEILNVLLLFLNIAGAMFLVRGMWIYMSARRVAGKQEAHIFPKRWVLYTAMIANVLGLAVTWYSYAVAENQIMLLLAAVFLMNTYTMIQRIATIHENGFLMYSKFHSFDDIKKHKWGQAKKRYQEMAVRFGRKDVPDVYLNVPNDMIRTVDELMKTHLKKK